MSARVCVHERVLHLSKVVKGTLWYFMAQVPFFNYKIGPGVMRLKSVPDITPGFQIYIRHSAEYVPIVVILEHRRHSESKVRVSVLRAVIAHTNTSPCNYAPTAHSYGSIKQQ